MVKTTQVHRDFHELRFSRSSRWWDRWDRGDRVYRAAMCRVLTYICLLVSFHKGISTTRVSRFCSRTAVESPLLDISIPDSAPPGPTLLKIGHLNHSFSRNGCRTTSVEHQRSRAGGHEAEHCGWSHARELRACLACDLGARPGSSVGGVDGLRTTLLHPS